MANAFDQFDAPQPTASEAAPAASNPFDAFDRPSAPAPAPLASPPVMGPPAPTSHDFANGVAQQAIQSVLDAHKVGPLGRLGFGAVDPLLGIGQLEMHGYGALTGDTGPAARTDAALAARERDYQARRAESGSTGFDGYRLLGSTAATLPLAAAMPAGGGVIGATAAGAASGALGGAVEPAIGGGNFASEKLDQIKSGALGGAVTGGATRAIAGAVGPQISDAVMALRNAGVPTTLGQTLGGAPRRIESAMQSAPILGDRIGAAKLGALEGYNRSAIEGTLGQIGEELPAAVGVGRQAVAHAGERISAAYNDVLPRLNPTVDMPFFNDLAGAARTANVLPQAQRDQFARIIQDRLARRIDPATGILPGRELQAARSDIAGLARNYTTSTDGDQRILGRALDEVTGAMMGLAERSSPADAARLQDINRAYAMQLRLENAGSRAGTAARDGIFTPQQLDAAVRDMATSRREYARGHALMQDYAQAGVQALGETLPDSGTATRRLATNIAEWPALMAFALASGAYRGPAQPIMTGAVAGLSGVRRPVGDALRAAVPAISAGAGVPAIPLLLGPGGGDAK